MTWKLTAPREACHGDVEGRGVHCMYLNQCTLQLCTVHCVTVHFTLKTLHGTLHIVNSTLYNVKYKLCTVTVYSKLYSLKYCVYSRIPCKLCASVVVQIFFSFFSSSLFKYFNINHGLYCDTWRYKQRCLLHNIIS